MMGILVLEDGTTFEGISIGVPGEIIGEVMLNTAVVGYQEIMTDPANAGKIVVLTYPLVGNYGVAEKFSESQRCWIGGLVIKEKSRTASNWQATDTLDNFLSQQNVIALSDIDTRTLAVTIRDKGEMMGIIGTGDVTKEEALDKLKSAKGGLRRSWIKEISVKSPIKTGESTSGKNIVVLDLGILRSFIRQLERLNASITLVPYNTPAEKLLKMKPDGVIISGGPENDDAVPGVAAQVKKMLGQVPILGISTGLQIIALALGCTSKKMKVGHHGVNYPVKSDSSLKGEITVQNHSYVVDDATVKTLRDVEISLRNINDNTIEEMVSQSLKFIGIQYYPACPGFDEVNEVFKRFFAMIDTK